MLVDTKHIPILILTATSEDVVAKALDMDGNTYYLAKPYKREVLLSLVKQILS